jgi:glycosyltransferase involved in cell wall biosynthesis
MEAMASGCPVVTTDLEGNLDLIENNVTGILVRQRNSEEIFRGAIKMLEDRRIKESIIRTAMKKVSEGFDWKIISKRYAEILK